MDQQLMHRPPICYVCSSASREDSSNKTNNVSEDFIRERDTYNCTC